MDPSQSKIQLEGTSAIEGYRTDSISASHNR